MQNSKIIYVTPIEKINALLTQVLNVPAELSGELCEKLKLVPEESQKILLNAFCNKVQKIKASKEDALREIKDIKKKMIAETEDAESKNAEKSLSESLKNI